MASRAPMRVLAGVMGIALAAQAAPHHTKPVHVLQMKQRPRPIKDEQVQRVEHFRKKTQALKFAVGIVDETYSEDEAEPNIETEAYYAYPLTLDYVVDVAFQNGTEMVTLPVIVDTGSSNLAVAVRECTNCDTGSTTLELGWYEEELCIEVVYGSGAWSGEMSEKIKVGFIDGDKKLLDDVYVAGITSSNGFFCGGFYGILGLAYSGLSESYSTCSNSNDVSGRSGSAGHDGGSHHRISSSSSSASRAGTGTGHHSSPYTSSKSSTNQQRNHNNNNNNNKNKNNNNNNGRSSKKEGHGDNRHASHQPGSVSSRQQASAPTQPAQQPVDSRHPLLIVEGSDLIDLQEDGDETTVTAPPLLDSFYEDGLSTSNQFSILFCGNQASMAIGGVDDSQMTSEVVYVDTKKTYDEMYGYFLVEVSSISIGGTVVSTDVATINQVGGVLVDSGTTLIYFPQSVTSAIENQIMKTLPGVSTSFFAWSTCVHESELKNFPSLTISLDGYDLVLSPNEYLLWYGGCYYWGISPSSVSIIGNVALQGRLVVFDKAQNKIGFADGDCAPYGGSTFSDDEAMAIHGPVESNDFVAESLSSSPPSSIQQPNIKLSVASSTATSFSGTNALAVALITIGVALIIEGVRRTRQSRHAGYSRVPDEIVI